MPLVARSAIAAPSALLWVFALPCRVHAAAPDPAPPVQTQDAKPDNAPANVPAPPRERLPTLQRLGWWHVLGALSLGTAAGVFAGLAEREEDRVTRIAVGFDLSQGRSTLYAEREDDYERALARGEAYQATAYVLSGLAAATAVVAATFFVLDARRKPAQRAARRTRLGPGTMEVRF